MNHGNKQNHLGRKTAHLHALMANMATALIVSKRITTTVAKAKALRKFVEPLITKAKNDSTHSRRIVFSYLRHKDPIKELFGEVANRVADRPGGYTRILKTGTRLGDGAEMCIIELVDFNEFYTTSKKAAVSKTRRKRSTKKATTETPANENKPAASSDSEETAAE